MRKIIVSYNSWSGKIYAVLRWLICPFHPMEQYMPVEGKIFDLGCGEGVFTQYLALSSKKRRVIGVDLDKRKISLARRAGSKISNLRFREGNVLTINLQEARGVVLSDFLHHLNFVDQRRLVARIAKEMREGGILMIKEINSNDFFRSRLSRFWDFVFYPKDKIYYQDLVKLKKELEALGFAVQMRKEALHFPGSTNLLICTKKKDTKVSTRRA